MNRIISILLTLSLAFSSLFNVVAIAEHAKEETHTIQETQDGDEEKKEEKKEEDKK